MRIRLADDPQQDRHPAGQARARASKLGFPEVAITKFDVRLYQKFFPHSA
jgi:S-ribosylhomocysteine lyase LuxS involved in autoinducer biosynthesis